MNENMERAIDAKRQQARKVLKEVERNFQITIQAHIDYHKFLTEESKKRNDISTMAHHRILMKTYEGILNNYSMSNSYNNV
jgi:hypothetical protein